MKNRRIQFLLPVVGLCAAMLPCNVRAQGSLPELVQTLKSYHYGESATPLDQLTAQVAVARLTPEKRKETAAALAGVLTSTATFEAKQFACRQLVFVAGEEQIPALAGLLSDDKLAHYALYALARIHSPAEADALLKALPRTSGNTSVEILNTLADQGESRAFSAFTERLHDKDVAVRDAAVNGLAKLGDARSARILRSSYAGSAGALRVQIGHALVECASRLARRGDTAGAAESYSLLEKTPASPFLEAVALRGLAGVNGEKALPMLMEALSAEGSPRQEAAATTLRELSGEAVSARLAAAALKMPPQGQRLAVEILGDRADRSAAPAVLKLCRSQDAGVRVAALRACRTLGDALAVPLLLQAAASGPAPERAAARDSLAAIRGADVDKALLSALEAGAPAMQVEAIQALGKRASPGIAVDMMKYARSKDPSVSAAALRVVRDRGIGIQINSLIDLLVTAPLENRDAVIEAIGQIARRNAQERTNGNDIDASLLVQRLSAASRPAEQVALLTALGQVGGPRALEAVRKALNSDQAEVRAAALTVLTEWQSDEPMNDLLKAAQTLPDERQRALALRGFLRMVGSDEQRQPLRQLLLYKGVEALASHPEEKRLILSGLSKIPSLQALEYASRLGNDKQVQAEAELAIADIGRGTLGAWPEETRKALEPIAKSGSSEEARKRAQAVLDSGKKFGDYIVAWEVSPPYQKEGADYQRLFDMPFPPELPGQAVGVAWRPLPVGGNPEQPWLLDLLAQWPGEQRVAYLRTAVWSETARDLSLEMGSDDGLKVWWNGEVVLSHNIARAVVPGQEKVTVHLTPGWNQLLLKITQNNQGWGAAARFTNTDGTPATGLRYALPSTQDRLEGLPKQ